MHETTVRCMGVQKFPDINS